MRVLALVTEAFGGEGGIAQYNRDFLTALASSEAVKTVIVLPRQGRPRPGEEPKKVNQLPPSPSKIRFAFRAAVVLIAQGPFDIVWCGHLYMAPLLACLTVFTRSQTWMQVYGIEAWQCPNRSIRVAIKKVAHFFAVSRYTRRKFLSWADLDPAKVSVLPGAIDLLRFQPGPKPETLSDRYQLRGKQVLLTVGRLSASEKYKGHDQVIAALPELIQVNPAWVYVVAGDGDDQARLEKLAEERGVRSHVRFTGKIQEAQLPELYRAADIFVMPSCGEGFGIVYLEALATGLPVIAADYGGVRDPLREGLSGALVDTRKGDTLVSAIQRVEIESVDSRRRNAAIFSHDFFQQHIQQTLQSFSFTAQMRQ